MPSRIPLALDSTIFLVERNTFTYNGSTATRVYDLTTNNPSNQSLSIILAFKALGRDYLAA